MTWNKTKAVVCCVVLSVLAACEKEQNEPVRPVSVYTVQKSGENLTSSFPAVVEAGNEANLSFKVAGPVLEFPYEVGAFVKKGQVIARLDTRDYLIQSEAAKEKMLAAKNAYLGAKAQADNARKQYKRLEALYKENALAKKKFDEAKAMVEGAAAKENAAYAGYREAKQGYANKLNMQKDTELLAPYDGYVKRKFMDIGSVVSAGLPVLTFSSSGKKKVQISVSRHQIELFENSPSCSFVYGDREYPLILQTLGKVRQSLDLVYPVVFYFENDKNLLVGSEGNVLVSSKNTDSEALSVPVESVFEKNDRLYVWKFEDNRVKLQEVFDAKPQNSGNLTVKGLKIGDVIVVKGVYDLYDGQRAERLEEFSATNVGKVL